MTVRVETRMTGRVKTGVTSHAMFYIRVGEIDPCVAILNHTVGRVSLGAGLHSSS